MNDHHEMTVHVNGVDLHVETHGQGEPLLWLHGMGGRAGDVAHAGRDRLAARYRLFAIDARGHGRSTPADTVSHHQHALDVVAVLDHLGVTSCRAIGCSMGGNALLHLATIQPGRLDAMVVVSSVMRFPEQARAIMRASPSAMVRALADDPDDMSFTPERLAAVHARTLVVYGDRDYLYPVEIGVELYRAIPRAELWVVPGGGHGPIFAEAAEDFVRASFAFFDRGR
jgi:pimeloyl-ACP methyl ester carboxylesterase